MYIPRSEAPRAATTTTAKRSACDRCRAKRVRCPRSSTITGLGSSNSPAAAAAAAAAAAPCARCVQAGAQCVTSSPGYPGRPRKNAVRRSLAAMVSAGVGGGNGSNFASPGDVDTSVTAYGGDELMNMNSDFWTLLAPPGSDDASTNLFDFSPLITAPLPPAAPTDQSSSHHFELPSAGLDVNASANSSQSAPNQNPAQAQPRGHLNALSLLTQFRGKMDQRLVAVGDFFSEPRSLMENCKANHSNNDIDNDNPVAIVLSCTKELVDIVQQLTAVTDSSSLPNTSTTTTAATTTTEAALLVLMSHLALMKLYDSLFQGVYRCMCQLTRPSDLDLGSEASSSLSSSSSSPIKSIKSIKVKAVLRIGGVSSLQDIPIKTYAMGIIDVIQNHIQSLERCLGLPPAYCVSSEDVAAQGGAAAVGGGLFASEDRVRLLNTVMAQEDITQAFHDHCHGHGDGLGHGKSKSYVESIRENIKTSIALFGD